MHDAIFRFNHDMRFADNCVLVSIFVFMGLFLIVALISTSFKTLIPYRFWIIGIFYAIFAPTIFMETWLIPNGPPESNIHYPNVSSAVRIMIKENPHNLTVPMSLAEQYLPN